MGISFTLFLAINITIFKSLYFWQQMENNSKKYYFFSLILNQFKEGNGIEKRSKSIKNKVKS